METNKKQTTLLIHPKGSTSTFVRTAIRGSGRIDLRSSCGSFEELSQELSSSLVPYTLVIVSSSFESHEAKAIHQLLLEHDKTFAAPVVLLVEPNVPQAEIMTQLLTGYDGVLMQPFSVDEFEMVLSDALASREHTEEVRLNKIMKTLVRSVRECQSEVAEKLSKGMPARVSRRVLTELALAVRDLPHHYYKEFFLAVFKEYLGNQRKGQASSSSGTPSSNRGHSDAPRRSSAGIFVQAAASGS